ncbi:MAG: redox-regulated ATPase YchF [Patescibacteria group bacterium]
MKLSVGIVGLPNVGKSTLFNALTKKSVPAENYPFCTIDPSVGVVPVPDERVGLLSEFSHSAKTLPAVIEFVDIAGLVKGAAEGEGLGNQFLANIRETDMIAEVVRIFEDGNVIHVSGGIDPLSDIEVINTELALADLATVEKRLISVEKDAKRGDTDAVHEKVALEDIRGHLRAGTPVSEVQLTPENRAKIGGLHLLTDKPILYVLNKKAGSKNLDELSDERWTRLQEFLAEKNRPFVFVDAGVEHELSSFEGEEKESFRKELGAKDDGINDLIKKSYEMLGLITYFTTGEDETRAWTIPRGATAPEAGTAIHTDFKDKFIRAEVVFWKDLIDVGSYAKAREKGLVRTEGKEYVVKDGDVVEFKI